MRDTTPAAEQRYFELLRAESASQRLLTAVRLTESVRAMARAGIQAQHPHATPEEVNAHLAERIYGATVANKLYPRVKRHV